MKKIESWKSSIGTLRRPVFFAIARLQIERREVLGAKTGDKSGSNEA